MAAKINKPKINRVRFSREELYNEYFEDMKCVACVSTLQPYQFAHTLNMILDRNFRREMELIEDKANKEYKVYFDRDDMRGIDYNVICNRNKTDFLIPELPNSDFLLLMNGMGLHLALFEEIFLRLQQHKKISYSYDFDPFQLKSKEYLIL